MRLFVVMAVLCWLIFTVGVGLAAGLADALMAAGGIGLALVFILGAFLKTTGEM